MKKSLQILVVMLFALLLLAACGQSADQEKDKSADEPKTEQKKNATEDEQKKDEP
ncbi:MAG TPA: TRAP transporter substrate-binding protein, partial [Candidatus Avamphibacillus intestinigallinarum]|nr:TRAP transporter substrate-binding protein [Candidatus Avamphibacillus intestinigallinarum]